MNVDKKSVFKVEESSRENTLGVAGLSTYPNGNSHFATQNLPLEFGRYRLLKQLGAGGMATVFLAYDTELDRNVALKLPHFEAAHGSQVDRFKREARMSATLDHPNICRIYDIGEHQGHWFLTMAYIEGHSLHEIIRAKGAISPRSAASLVQGVASTVEFAHTKGIIHRDLKPANIMVKNGKKFVVMDFGLARRFEKDDEQITATGAVLGTPAYMAPEQLRGESNLIGPQADVYSLGIVLYELLVGERPFQGTLPQIYSQVLTTDSVAPSFECGIDIGLCSICRKATATDLSQRYGSASELARDLGNYLSNNMKTVLSESGQAIVANPDMHKNDSEISHAGPLPQGIGNTPAPTLLESNIGSFRQAHAKARSNTQARPNWLPWVMGGAAAMTVAAFLATVTLSRPGKSMAEHDVNTKLAERLAPGISVNQTTKGRSGRGDTEGLAIDHFPAKDPAQDVLLHAGSSEKESAFQTSEIPEYSNAGRAASEPSISTDMEAVDGPAANSAEITSSAPLTENSREFGSRTWTDKSGRYRTEAVIVDASTEEVIIKKSDGNTIAIQRTNLSSEDEAYVAATEVLSAIDANRESIVPLMDKLVSDPVTVVDRIKAIQKKDRDPITSLWCGVIFASEGGKPGFAEAERYHDEAIRKLRSLHKYFPGEHAAALAAALNNRAILALRDRSATRAIKLLKELAEIEQELPIFAKHNTELLLELTRDSSVFKVSSSDYRTLTEIALLPVDQSLEPLPKRFMYSTRFTSAGATGVRTRSRLNDLRQDGLWPELTCFLCEGTGALRCRTCGGDGAVSSIVPDQIGFNDKTGQPIMGRKSIQVRCPDCRGKGGFECKNCDAGKLRLE